MAMASSETSDHSMGAVNLQDDYSLWQSCRRPAARPPSGHHGGTWAVCRRSQGTRQQPHVELVDCCSRLSCAFVRSRGAATRLRPLRKIVGRQNFMALGTSGLATNQTTSRTQQARQHGGSDGTFIMGMIGSIRWVITPSRKPSLLSSDSVYSHRGSNKIK